MCFIGLIIPWFLFFEVLFIFLGSILVLLGYDFVSLGFLVLVLSSVDIFEFLLRKKGWVELCIMLATQSIKAQAQRGRCRQACMIGSLLTRIQS